MCPHIKLPCMKPNCHNPSKSPRSHLLRSSHGHLLSYSIVYRTPCPAGFSASPTSGPQLTASLALAWSLPCDDCVPHSSQGSTSLSMASTHSANHTALQYGGQTYAGLLHKTYLLSYRWPNLPAYPLSPSPRPQEFRHQNSEH